MVALHNREHLDEALKLLLFGFRSVTREPDRILAQHSLSRIHHRILFFVAREPGLAMGGLLQILAVSKQALHRPLSELVRQELLVAEPGRTNRRTKELWLTPKGKKLEERVSGAQRARFSEAFTAAGPRAEKGWRDVMRTLADG